MLSVRTEVLCAVTNIDATPGYYLVQVGFKFHGSCGQARFIGGFEFDDDGWKLCAKANELRRKPL